MELADGSKYSISLTVTALIGYFLLSQEMSQCTGLVSQFAQALSAEAQRKCELLKLAIGLSQAGIVSGVAVLLLQNIENFKNFS